MANETKEGDSYRQDVVLSTSESNKLWLPTDTVKPTWNNSVDGFTPPNNENTKKMRKLLNLMQIEESIEIVLKVSEESAYRLNKDNDDSNVKDATKKREQFMEELYSMAESGKVLKLELGDSTPSLIKNSSGETVDYYLGYIKQIQPEISNENHTVTVRIQFEVGIDLQR